MILCFFAPTIRVVQPVDLKCGFFSTLEVSPQDLLSSPLGAFFSTVKKSAFEDPLATLLAYFKVLSRAVKFVRVTTDFSYLFGPNTPKKATPQNGNSTKRPLIWHPRQDDYQLKKPLPLAYTTDDWWLPVFSNKKSIYIYGETQKTRARCFCKL